MKFKRPKDRDDYRMLTGKYASESNAWLKMWVETLDKLSVMLGHGEIMVTSYIRPDDVHSRHCSGKAIDIRVRDKSTEWYVAMHGICRWMEELNPRFHVNPHWNQYRGEQPHIHLEVRE